MFILKRLIRLNNNLSKVRIYVGSDGKLHFVNSAGADTVLPFSSGEMIHIPYQAHPAGKAYSYTFPRTPQAIVILNGIGAGASPDAFVLSDTSWTLVYLRGYGAVSYYGNNVPQRQIGTLSVQGNVMTYPADGFPEREKYMIVTY